MSYVESLMKMLDASVSNFHAISVAENYLKEHGYIEFDEKKPFDVEKGGKYYVKRNGSSLIAFYVPEHSDGSFRLASCHSDSPTFKLKPNPLIQYKNIMSLTCEPYGGGIYPSWFDTPLSLAGRVMVRTKEGVSSRLFSIDDDVAYIPSVAIHMNREVNSKLTTNAAIDIVPMIGEVEEGFDFKKYLSNFAGGEVLDYDLYLYRRSKATLVGINHEFLSSPRLDDLAASFTVLEGFVNAKPGNSIPIYALFDNEEVGSLTKQGAASTFMQDTFKRLSKALGNHGEDYRMALANSINLSVDNAHANHPNHPEYSDETTDVRLNGGIVIKYNANQSYTTDAYSASIARLLCEKASIPFQTFNNRSDLRGGSTLGNICNTQVSLTALDIGLPQLAMHSSNELMGSKDVDTMVRFVETYYSSIIRFQKDDIIVK